MTTIMIISPRAAADAVDPVEAFNHGYKAGVRDILSLPPEERETLLASLEAQTEE